jgi:hypothetical protein
MDTVCRIYNRKTIKRSGVGPITTAYNITVAKSLPSLRDKLKIGLANGKTGSGRKDGTVLRLRPETFVGL